MATDYNSVKRVNKPLTAAETLRHEYYQMPKYLIKDPYYKKLSARAKILFTLINDRARMSLTSRNKLKWVNEKGEVYVIYRREDMANDLGMHKTNVKDVVDELIDIGLIKEEQLGLNRCNRIYILPPFYYVCESSGGVESPTPEVLNDHLQRCKFYTSGGVESPTQEVAKSLLLHCIKNNSIKTTLIKKSERENRQEKDAATPHQKTPPRAPSGESEKCANGKYGRVQLTATEYDELISVHGHTKTNQYIAELDEYIASKGERYKDHFATVNRWIRRADEEAAEKKTREEERNKSRFNSPGNYKSSDRDYKLLEMQERLYQYRDLEGYEKEAAELEVRIEEYKKSKGAGLK